MTSPRLLMAQALQRHNLLADVDTGEIMKVPRGNGLRGSVPYYDVHPMNIWSLSNRLESNKRDLHDERKLLTDREVTAGRFATADVMLGTVFSITATYKGHQRVEKDCMNQEMGKVMDATKQATSSFVTGEQPTLNLSFNRADLVNSVRACTEQKNTELKESPFAQMEYSGDLYASLALSAFALAALMAVRKRVYSKGLKDVFERLQITERNIGIFGKLDQEFR